MSNLTQQQKDALGIKTIIKKILTRYINTTQDGRVTWKLVIKKILWLD